MTINLFFWFDVEDYITPQSDAALGRLIGLFDRHGLKATFKLVGEKVRGLQRRGHDEILGKLQVHDIGYHTDTHSRPPTVAEYELHCGWDSGAAEFIRREQAGLDTVRTAFGRLPSCYGQPGGSWAPQVYPALRQWGIPTYLDEGPWVNLDGRPHRYCDILNIIHLDHLMHIGIGGGVKAIRQQLARLIQAVDQLQHTGGEISLFAHECEFVTSEFWDGVNFRDGQDTPPEQWQPAPLLSETESETRYAAMDDYLNMVCSLPEVKVVVAAQAPSLYPDHAKGRIFTIQEIVQLSAAMADTITHQEVDGMFLSPSEVFGLLAGLLAGRARTGEWPAGVPYRYLDGPSRPSRMQIVSGRMSLSDALGASLRLDKSLSSRGRLPAEVQVGYRRLSPADWLATISAALPHWLADDDEDMPVLKGHLDQARYIPDHVSWDWIIFPPGFDGDPLLELGRLQAWTLKPAKRKA